LYVLCSTWPFAHGRVHGCTAVLHEGTVLLLGHHNPLRCGLGLLLLLHPASRPTLFQWGCCASDKACRKPLLCKSQGSRFGLRTGLLTPLLLCSAWCWFVVRTTVLNYCGAQESHTVGKLERCLCDCFCIEPGMCAAPTVAHAFCVARPTLGFC